jgi:Rieske Fe-S protein
MAMNRRGWIAAVGKALAGLCTGGALLLVGRFVRPYRIADLGDRVVVGPIESLPRGGSIYLAEPDVHVMHEPAGIYALSGRCTHLGCSVRKQPEGFDCPCHGARFNLLGQPQAGPAPRTLTWLAVSVDRRRRLVVHLDQHVEPGTMLRA